MSNNKKEVEMKDLVTDLVKQLQASGVQVNGAAYLNLGNDKASPAVNEQIDQAVKNAMQKIGGIPMPGLKPPARENIEVKETPAETQERCFCPNCFRFETFEQTLDGLGGNFYYHDFELGGVKFTAKFWEHPVTKQRYMMVEETIEIRPENLTVANIENIQANINTAVQMKDFHQAQIFLDQLNQLKNQQKSV